MFSLNLQLVAIKKDIYQRVGLTKSGKTTMFSTISAFFVSALWHVSLRLALMAIFRAFSYNFL